MVRPRVGCEVLPALKTEAILPAAGLSHHEQGITCLRDNFKGAGSPSGKDNKLTRILNDNSLSIGATPLIKLNQQCKNKPRSMSGLETNTMTSYTA